MLKKIKNIIFSVILIFIFSCNSDDNITEEVPQSSSDNCFNVIMVGTSGVTTQCDSGLVFGVVRHKDFLKGGPFRQEIRTYVCVTKAGYTMNDFRLGKLICDLSVYE